MQYRQTRLRAIIASWEDSRMLFPQLKDIYIRSLPWVFGTLLSSIDWPKACPPTFTAWWGLTSRYIDRWWVVAILPIQSIRKCYRQYKFLCIFGRLLPYVSAKLHQHPRIVVGAEIFIQPLTQISSGWLIDGSWTQSSQAKSWILYQDCSHREHSQRPKYEIQGSCSNVYRFTAWLVTQSHRSLRTLRSILIPAIEMGLQHAIRQRHGRSVCPAQ